MGPDAAGAINGYYATVGLDLAEKFTSQGLPPTQYQIVPNIPELTFRFEGPKEVLLLINCLNVTKSSQLPEIKTLDLKAHIPLKTAFALATKRK